MLNSTQISPLTQHVNFSVVGQSESFQIISRKNLLENFICKEKVKSLLEPELFLKNSLKVETKSNSAADDKMVDDNNDYTLEDNSSRIINSDLDENYFINNNRVDYLPDVDFHYPNHQNFFCKD